MPVAVEFYFDDESSERFREVWDRMETEGLGTWIRNIGTEPHFSLAVFDDDVDRPLLFEVCEDFARTVEPFDIDLSSAGTFIDAADVVYVAPVPTVDLLELHERFHRKLTDAGLTTREYYRPGQWIPHCTVGADMETETIGRTIELLRNDFEFGRACCKALGVVSVPPVQNLERWPLTGTG